MEGLPGTKAPKPKENNKYLKSFLGGGDFWADFGLETDEKLTESTKKGRIREADRAACSSALRQGQDKGQARRQARRRVAEQRLLRESRRQSVAP